MNQVENFGRTALSPTVPISEHDAALLEKARLEYHRDFEMLAKLASEAESQEVRDKILDLERHAWKRYDLCEFFD